MYLLFVFHAISKELQDDFIGGVAENLLDIIGGNSGPELKIHCFLVIEQLFCGKSFSSVFTEGLLKRLLTFDDILLSQLRQEKVVIAYIQSTLQVF